MCFNYNIILLIFTIYLYFCFFTVFFSIPILNKLSRCFIKIANLRTCWNMYCVKVKIYFYIKSFFTMHIDKAFYDSKKTMAEYHLISSFFVTTKQIL